MKTIENLAFKGGGVLGAAYAGVYRALQEVKLLGSKKLPTPQSEIAYVPPRVVDVYGNVKRVAGTSAGAIFATMVALGLNAEEAEAVVKGTSFASLVDFDWGFAGDGGFLKGALFLNWMRRLVYDNFGAFIGVPDPTFGDLADAIAGRKGKFHPGLLKDLHVFSRQVSPSRTVEFSAETTPDVPISQAVRASMSIPFIFVPWAFTDPQLAENYPGLFFDGGTAFNYPVSAFDSGEADKKTLGFYLADLASYQQGMFELLVHMAMKATTPPVDKLEASIVETTMEWALLAYQRNYIDPFDQAQFVKSQLIDAGGHKHNLAHANKMLKTVSEARQIMLKTGDRRAAANHFKKKKLITNDQYDFYNALDKWYEAICSVQNTPTNMVFDRDASRTIFIDTLGYIYFDFYLPDWDTANLIDSGYACTRSYLSFIMYS